MTITFQNVGPQPQYLSDDKVKCNTAASRRSRPDIALFAEHDLNPSKLKCGNTFSDRQSTAIPGTTSYLVNNCHESDRHTFNQWGGTAFSVAPAYTNSVITRGKDPTDLGRWCWVHLRGKRNKKVCLVSAYQPNSSPGPNTVYAQQV